MLLTPMKSALIDREGGATSFGRAGEGKGFDSPIPRTPWRAGGDFQIGSGGRREGECREKLRKTIQSGHSGKDTPGRKVPSQTWENREFSCAKKKLFFWP